MSDRQRVQELDNALGTRLGARMSAAGWHVDPTGPGDGVGLFRRPLNEDFAVTAWFGWLAGSFPPLQVDSIVGVSYERSYRVWPYLLSGYPHSEFQVGAQGLVQASRFVELWELDEADRAVSQLVQPVLDRAIAWAEPFASTEDLLAALRAWTDPAVEVMDVPVVLAASGRIEDARHAMATAMVVHRDQARDLLMDDFKLRFETWAAAGAPPTPPDG